MFDQTYQFIRDNHGVDTWKSYPYEAKVRNLIHVVLEHCYSAIILYLLQN